MQTAPSSAVRRAIWVLAVVAYAIFLASHAAPVAGGADSSGYLNSARLLTQGRLRAPVRRIADLPYEALPPWLYSPLGFMPTPGRTELTPTYPVGLPLHLALAAGLVGWDLAPLLVNIALSIAGLWFMLRLGRELGLEESWAIAGALLLGAFPVHVLYSLQPMSDMPAASYCIGATWCALRGRDRAAWALCAGVLFSIAVLVRPSNSLLLLPIAVVLGARLSSWGAFVLGGLPAAAFLSFYNLSLYGQPLTSGYGAVGGLFSWNYLLPTLAHFVKWLSFLLSPLLLLCFVGLPWSGRPRAVVWMLATWLASFVVFYGCYFHSSEAWWYLRYLLPAVPALILGGFLVARQLFARLAESIGERRSAALSVAVLGIILANAIWWNQNLHVTRSKHEQSAYKNLAIWANASLPEGSVLAVMQCSGSQFFYSRFPIMRWDQLEPETFAMVARALITTGRPLYAALFPFEREQAALDGMPGKWLEVEEFGPIRVFEWSGRPPQ